MTLRTSIPEHINNIITDSRRITPSDIRNGHTAFVALRTAVGDGHRYIRQLYTRGLRYFIVNDVAQFADLTDATFIVVEGDTLDFMISHAGKLLLQRNTSQIVVTGSIKKTTVKELLTKAFKQKGIKTARSPRTWNSAMGATLSIFDNLRRDPEILITEIGIDAPGQVERIRPLLRPSIGILTPITDEHDDSFTSHAEKVREKISIVAQADKIFYMTGDSEVERQLQALNHPAIVAVDTIEDLVYEVTGVHCPTIDFSTCIEVRRVPDNGIMFIDSFVNDLDSLPLSLALAVQRQAGRKLVVLLGNFEGDRSRAAEIVGERGGKLLFFEKKDAGFIQTLHRSDFADSLILIKGATPDLITYFDEARHDTTLQVDLDAIVHNYNVYRRLLPRHTGIIAMVKADAYGLGALEVSKTLQSHGAAYLAVAVIDEAIALRKAGVIMPIIVLNPITNRFDALADYSLEPTIFSLEELDRIEVGLHKISNSKIPVHIKLDTGMHRLGFVEDELDTLVERIKSSRYVTPASIFSHLATADCTGSEKDNYTGAQIKDFDTISQRIIKKLGYPVKRHILNTAGIERLGRTKASYDMARLGLGLYGLSPVPLQSGSEECAKSLRMSARLVSTIISLKKWPEGTPIGYGCTDITKRDSYIATLPIGYADGIDRRLGNGRGIFAVNGVHCPTIGNICMDLLMLDVTDAVESKSEVTVGTEVEIFGPTAPIQKIAKTLGTISYELLTSVSPRVRRTYHQR